MSKVGVILSDHGRKLGTYYLHQDLEMDGKFQFWLLITKMQGLLITTFPHENLGDLYSSIVFQGKCCF